MRSRGFPALRAVAEISPALAGQLARPVRRVTKALLGAQSIKRRPNDQQRHLRRRREVTAGVRRHQPRRHGRRAGVLPARKAQDALDTATLWTRIAAIALGIIALIILGIGMFFSGRRHDGGETLKGLGWWIGGAALIGAASGVASISSAPCRRTARTIPGAYRHQPREAAMAPSTRNTNRRGFGAALKRGWNSKPAGVAAIVVLVLVVIIVLISTLLGVFAPANNGDQGTAGKPAPTSSTSAAADGPCNVPTTGQAAQKVPTDITWHAGRGGITWPVSAAVVRQRR